MTKPRHSTANTRLMSIRRSISTTMVSLCALAGWLLLAGAPAQAAARHEYLSRIAEIPANGPHGETVPSHGPLGVSFGMTVDSGELYDVEGFSNSRIDKFNASSGAFISQFAQVPPPIYDLRQGLAVGHATGQAEVYVGGDEPTGSRPEGLEGGRHAG
jgi:hypothetical protein